MLVYAVSEGNIVCYTGKLSFIYLKSTVPNEHPVLLQQQDAFSGLTVNILVKN